MVGVNSAGVEGSVDRRLQELKKCFCGALIRAKWQEVWVDAKILFWSHLKSSESRRPRSSDSLVGWIYKKRFIAQTLVDSESESESEVAQSCRTLCDLMDCSLSVSIHGIFQARVLEWGAISFSRGSS